MSVLSPDLLVTAQHVFFQGRRAAVPFGSCSFRSYLHRNVAIPVVVEKDQRRGYVFHNEDFIVVRLKRALEGCNSFAINDSDSSLPEGEQIFSVTGQQFHTLNKISDREPVLATGKIRGAYDGLFGGPPYYYADIDLDEGGSGGAVFALKDGRPVSDDHGRLILRGILVAYGVHAKNGRPYSEDQNYTIIIGAQHDFRDLVKGKAQKAAAVEPALCLQGGAAKINVISDSVPSTQSETLAPFQDTCSRDATPDPMSGKMNAMCMELAKLTKGLKRAASQRVKGKNEFRLKNDTSCPICFTYDHCNDYGCWDEAARLSGNSTLFVGVRERAPVIKNPQFCKSGWASADVGAPLPPTKPALAHIKFPATDAESPPPLPLRRPEQTPTGAADARKHVVEPKAAFLAAKEKANREGVWTLTSEDIRGLNLEQIKELRGY